MFDMVCEDIFPTKIYKFQIHDNIIDVVKKQLNVYRIENPKSYVNEYYCSHIQTNKLDFTTELDYIHTKLLQSIRANHTGQLYIEESWVNIMPRNTYYHWHRHGAHGFAAILYLDNIGKTIFYDPRAGNHNGDDEYYIQEAKKGLIMIFPTWLAHSIPHHTSDEERYTMSFNIRTESKYGIKY
jgi:hypothetical protein